MWLINQQTCAAFDYPCCVLLYKKVIGLFKVWYEPHSNSCCHFPPDISCWFYLPVVLIKFPVENGACRQRVHSWLEDKTSRL